MLKRTKKYISLLSAQNNCIRHIRITRLQKTPSTGVLSFISISVAEFFFIRRGEYKVRNKCNEVMM